jgi:hypothetical protein
MSALKLVELSKIAKEVNTIFKALGNVTKIPKVSMATIVNGIPGVLIKNDAVGVKAELIVKLDELSTIEAQLALLSSNTDLMWSVNANNEIVMVKSENEIKSNSNDATNDFVMDAAGSKDYTANLANTGADSKDGVGLSEADYTSAISAGSAEIQALDAKALAADTVLASKTDVATISTHLHDTYGLEAKDATSLAG